MAQVFISYKREDRERVGAIVDTLREAGITTWWDQDIPPGAEWRKTIVQNLDAAELCIVAWSEASTAEGGRYVIEEAERAAGRRAYLGVLIDNVMPPFGFTESQAIDLSHWRGKPDDPHLRYFVDTVRARLDGSAAPATPAPPRPRRRRSNLPLLAGAGALVLLLAAAAFFLLRPSAPEEKAAPSATTFVNTQLAQLPCTWVSIAGINSAPQGDRIQLRGIAAAPSSIQPALLQQARAQGVNLADVDVREVLPAPQSVCGALQVMQPYRSTARSRLELTPQIGPMIRDSEGWLADMQFTVDYDNLPPHAAILGLDSARGIERMVPDLATFRREGRPVRTEGSRMTYASRFSFDVPDERNVGLILMTSTQPIDLDLVESIGRSTDPETLRRVEEAAKAGNWQFELGIVRCGIEGGAERRC